MRNAIKVSKPILEDNNLTNIIEVSENLKKYFRSNKFTTVYDAKIANKESILNVSILSTILPIAWLTNSDLYIDELDRNFYESMQHV